MADQVVALSGELGSGKSEVSARLARALGARRVSTGEAQRTIARQRGISTLELNRAAERDRTIDDEIDGVFRSLDATQDPLVVDSRLAWHFLPRSYKVHLVVDPRVGASRVLHRTGGDAEHYESLDDALDGIARRVESERHRFQELYGVDIFRLANYDLVVDTTRATPDEVTDAVLDRCRGEHDVSTRPFLLLSPGRVAIAGGAGSGPAPRHDGQSAAHDGDGTEGDGTTEAGTGTDEADDEDDERALEHEVRVYGISRLAPIVVAYRRPEFSLVRGLRRLRVADRCGLAFVPAILASGGERGADVAAS
jgi:predicted cytidylate kinase